MNSIALKVLLIGLFTGFSSIIGTAQSAQPERVKVGKTTLFKKECTTNSKTMTCTLCEDSRLRQKCEKYTKKADGTYLIAAAPQTTQSSRVKKQIKVKGDPDDGGEVTGKK